MRRVFNEKIFRCIYKRKTKRNIKEEGNGKIKKIIFFAFSRVNLNMYMFEVFDKICLILIIFLEFLILPIDTAHDIFSSYVQMGCKDSNTHHEQKMVMVL